MKHVIGTSLKARFKAWVMKRVPVQLHYVLGFNNLYIVPSSFGLMYAFVVLALFVASINYQLSPAFFLTFFLLILGMMSIWFAHRNLQDLEVNFVEVSDVMAMQSGCLTIFLRSAKSPAVNLRFMMNDTELGFVAMVSQEGVQITLALPSRARGIYELPLIKIVSEFPFGLLRVWGYLRFSGVYYVYPTPINPGFLPEPQANVAPSLSKQRSVGDDVFEGVKAVDDPWGQKGRIAWKISARGQGYFVKTMASEAGHAYLLTLHLSEGSLETRLSHLAFWLMTLEQLGFEYGLELPAIKVGLARGRHHLQAALRGLARLS